jgi:hypothetical protein
VPYYASAEHSLQHRRLAADLELGKSPGFLEVEVLSRRSDVHVWQGIGDCNIISTAAGDEIATVDSPLYSFSN